MISDTVMGHISAFWKTGAIRSLMCSFCYQPNFDIPLRVWWVVVFIQLSYPNPCTVPLWSNSMTLMSMLYDAGFGGWAHVFTQHLWNAKLTVINDLFLGITYDYDKTSRKKQDLDGQSKHPDHLTLVELSEEIVSFKCRTLLKSDFEFECRGSFFHEHFQEACNMHFKN